MSTYVEFDGNTYELELSQAHSIAIPLKFNGEQPNHFGAKPAVKSTLIAGEFVGDTAKGGSCNVTEVSLNPHCNGTHTETVQHIVDEKVHIGDSLTSSLTSCYVLSVAPISADSCQDSYSSAFEAADNVITKAALEQQLSPQDLDLLGAVVIRTLPNSSSKCQQVYDTAHQPPFFTSEAIEWLSLSNIHHLLVDFPSIDKMYDQGLLSNHHTFWNVPQGSHQLTETTLTHRTVTEMIYVDDDITDGLYWLNLQLPHFELDVAPSRPVIYPLTDLSSDLESELGSEFDSTHDSNTTTDIDDDYVGQEQ